MFALSASLALLDWPRPDGWTFYGFWATVLGLLVGIIAAVLAWLIYRWTSKTDDERHGELTFALNELKHAYEAPQSSAAAPDADLSELPPEGRDRLAALLDANERIIRLAKTGAGKGNRPWLAMTSEGRVLRAYRGGRTGGWHVSVLY